MASCVRIHLSVKQSFINISFTLFSYLYILYFKLYRGNRADRKTVHVLLAVSNISKVIVTSLIRFG